MTTARNQPFNIIAAAQQADLLLWQGEQAGMTQAQVFADALSRRSLDTFGWMWLLSHLLALDSSPSSARSYSCITSS